MKRIVFIFLFLLFFSGLSSGQTTVVGSYLFDLVGSSSSIISNFNLTYYPQSVTGWTNAIVANPVNGDTTEDVGTGFFFNAIKDPNIAGMPIWYLSGTNNFGETTNDGGGFAIPDSCLKTLWYNFAYEDTMYYTHPNIILSGLNPSKLYDVTFVGSFIKGSAGVNNSILSIHFIGSGTGLIWDTLTVINNTSKFIKISNVSPLGDGTFLVTFLGYGSTSNPGVLNGVIIKQDD